LLISLHNLLKAHSGGLICVNQWNIKVLFQGVASTSHGEGDQKDTSSLSLTVTVITDISKVAPEEWDACALEAAGEGARNPFLSHAFLLSLEESKSAVKVSA
jgi:hypothetical protein